MKQPPYTHEQLVRQAQFSPEDLKHIKQRRREHNRLGFAYQLAFVRLFNLFPKAGKGPDQQDFERDEEILSYVGLQLGLPLQIIDAYSQRRMTVSRHQKRIRKYLGLRRFSKREQAEVEQFIFDEACRLEQSSALLARTRTWLKSRGILEPAEYTLKRIIQTQRQAARTAIFSRIATELTEDARDSLDALLSKDQRSHSSLYRLKKTPNRPSPGALLRLARKLEQIEETEILSIDLSWLNNNFQRAMTRYARRCTAFQLRQLLPERRYAVLTCFLWQLHRDTLDEMVDMFDKLMGKVYNRAQKDIDAFDKAQRKQMRVSLSSFKTVAELILDETIADEALREVLFSRIEKEQLEAQAAEVDVWLNGKHSHVFNRVMERFSYLRQFSPAVVKHIQLQAERGAEVPVLPAVALLQDMNEAGRRKLPADAPMDFIPKRLRRFVLANGTADKAAWECALLTAVRDEIRAGNLCVPQSKRFARLDDFFIPEPEWQAQREAFFERARLPSKAEEVEAFLTERLGQAYDRFLQRLPENSYAQIDEEGWHLSTEASEKLDKQAEERLDNLKTWLSEHMRVIKLPELLIEVDNELHFTRHFMTPAEREDPNVDHVCAVLATIMAHGCNIGPYTMSHLTPGISYNRIKKITDWLLTDEAQRSALALVVNAISRLDITQAWGEGKTSSSDGQRFTLSRKVLQQTYSPRFNDFALEFYSFIADNYAPYYVTPIECTDRDAPYVIDGLLYNESDLSLVEHYTDTHGYTEINFAAFAMFGWRFAPRIRGLQKQWIYRIERRRDYGPLSVLVDRRDRTIHMDWIVEQWDRVGHFYASLESGHTTASVALKRLNGFTGKNHFYRANRELGRIFKTEHILDYLSDQGLRRRTRRGLLKGEQLHALARDLNYGKRGRISKRDWQEQRNSCSSLTLILASIIYWQAKEIHRVLNECSPEESGVDVSLIEHVSPITWDNVILYGEYVLNRGLVRV